MHKWYLKHLHNFAIPKSFILSLYFSTMITAVVMFKANRNWNYLEDLRNTLLYYKNEGEVDYAKIWNIDGCFIVEISCTLNLYKRMLTFIKSHTIYIMELYMGGVDYAHEYPIEISHIEEAKKKARYIAQKTATGAKNAGNYVYEHREQIKKGAVVAAEIAPLVLI